MRKLISLLAGLSVVLLAACDEPVQVAKPQPQELTRDAVGHYCNMIVADHKGPKAQLFLTDEAAPIWFSSVRDAIAFTMLPGEARNIAVVYVNDMGRASWDTPEPGTWIEAAAAIYVIGSDRRGGMGALEAVPFSDAAKAEAFMARHGGRTVRFDEMPEDYILASDEPASHGDHMPPAQDAMGEEDGHDDHQTH